MFRRLATLSVVPVALALTAGPALAHECVNASKKNQGAGVQVIFGNGDDPLWVSRGLQRRIDRGIVDLDTGEGFHGLIGIDFNEDGKVDFATYIVGPQSRIPVPAQMRGAECKGIVNVEQFFDCME